MTAIFTFLLEQNNYGQRLQNYALQRFLMDEFVEDAVTMDCDPSRKGADIRDNRYFHAFERECMKTMDIRKAGPDLLSAFDHIVLGGDQVLNTRFGQTWNILPYISGRRRKLRNIFSYAAGVSHRHSVDGRFIEGLCLQMYAYGLREDCRDVDYVKNIDPVFLIMDRWGDVAMGDAIAGGTVKYTVRAGSVAELYRTADDGSVAVKYSDGGPVIDPRVFVGMFRGASRVVTNSFHGICFGLMNRVSEIEILNSGDHRIVNLKNLLGISMDGCKVLNYDDIFIKIRQEVEKSRRYIAKCLRSNVVDYCAYSKTRETRDRSSSGGAAPELAKVVMSKGGCVFGGAFSDDFKKVVPYCARTMDDYFAKLSKSKYSFCPLPDIDVLRGELAAGKPVMYIGCPCHMTALRKTLVDVPDNLILVDFKCRGYSHPDKLRNLVEAAEERLGGKVSGIDFRPAHRCEVEIRTANGKTERHGPDLYRQFIFDTLPKCRKCPLAHGVGLSCADITLSDFWANSGDRFKFGAEFTPDKGCSVVTINTEKGRTLWEEAKESMEYLPLLT